MFIHERVSNYNVPLLGRIVTRFESEALRDALRVFAITDKVARTVVAKYPWLEGKVVTNYPGMDVRYIRPYKERKNEVISVAMWDYGRRPELYLEIASRLPQWRFLMVGSWRIASLRMKIINMKESMNIENMDIIEGISEEQLGELYSESKFLLRFGFGEYGLATAVTEAISYGTPVIMNDELGTADLIAQNSAGVVVSDPLKAVGAINEYDNESKYEGMQQGTLRISKIYSWTNHARKLIAI